MKHLRRFGLILRTVLWSIMIAHANCPPQILNEIQQGTIPIRIQFLGVPDGYQAAWELKLRASLGITEMQNSGTASGIIRAQAIAKREDAKRWNAFLSLSIWIPAWTIQGEMLWAPCLDQWIWNTATLSELTNDWGSLVQQTKNNLIQEQYNENNSVHPAPLAQSPCPIPGYCTRDNMPTAP